MPDEPIPVPTPAPDPPAPDPIPTPPPDPPTPGTLLGGADPAPEPPKPGEPPPTDPKETEPKPTGAPEKYEWTAPDGTALDTEALGKFEPLARELNLSQEQANKLVSLQADLVRGQSEAWTKQVSDWRSETEKDPELGGEGSPAIQAAGAALKRFGTEALLKDLNAFGLGNHPEFVRFCVRVGKAMGEDNTHIAGGAPESGDIASRMFPKSMQ